MALTQKQEAAKNALANEMASYVFQLRVEVDRRHVPHVGSCIFLRVGPRLFALSAAHVFDQNRDKTLFVVTPTTSVILKGQKHCSPSEYPDHRDDPFDVGILALDERTSAALDAVNAVGVQDCDTTSPPLPGATYFACGFPHTKNRKVNVATAKVTANRFKCFTNSCPPKTYKMLGKTPGQHFVVGFNKRHLIQNNRDVTAPHPFGVSGGGLWKTTGRTHKLTGILNEWAYPVHHVNALVATHVRFFLKGIASFYPDVADILGPALARATKDGTEEGTTRQGAL
ncbi:hypothetical protein NXS98_06245 [Fontisphaera persica]|uniref:hypothetical protein n=1 Tax=Fontisphaera persica TaxID=2974023 RepID=UPI0024C0D302|nr:hypothetical protein [Fontisphaera persica]WCJ60725.1 hypothetical protein NXS98_06245 [Fontisphaera persica]